MFGRDDVRQGPKSIAARRLNFESLEQRVVLTAVRKGKLPPKMRELIVCAAQIDD